MNMNNLADSQFFRIFACRFKNNSMAMKITRIKTRTGEFGVPVSVELSTVVEQMSSEHNKEAADRIATAALQ